MHCSFTTVALCLSNVDNSFSLGSIRNIDDNTCKSAVSVRFGEDGEYLPLYQTLVQHPSS